MGGAHWYELSSTVTSSASVVGKSPVSVFSGSFFSGQLAHSEDILVFSLAGNVRAGQENLATAGVGSGLCLCLSIFSAVHTVPLSLGWQLLGSPSAESRFHGSPSCLRPGRQGWERVRIIQGSKCSVNNFFSQYSFCSLPAPFQFCCLLLVFVDCVFKNAKQPKQSFYCRSRGISVCIQYTLFTQQSHYCIQALFHSVFHCLVLFLIFSPFRIMILLTISIIDPLFSLINLSEKEYEQLYRVPIPEKWIKSQHTCYYLISTQVHNAVSTFNNCFFFLLPWMGVCGMVRQAVGPTLLGACDLPTSGGSGWSWQREETIADHL